jgi:WD40 repeat protein
MVWTDIMRNALLSLCLLSQEVLSLQQYSGISQIGVMHLKPGRDVKNRLPLGAVFRLGDCRLQASGQIRQSAFGQGHSLVCLENGGVSTWDTRTGALEKFASRHFARRIWRDIELAPAIALAPAAGAVAEVKDCQIYVRDLSGKSIARFVGSGPYSWVRFSEDGGLVVAVRADKERDAEVSAPNIPAKRRQTKTQTAISDVWDLSTGKRVRSFEGDVIAISGKGKSCVTLGNGQVSVWDTVNGKVKEEIRGRAPLAGSLLSPTGDRLVLSPIGENYKRQVVIWDTERGREVARFPRIGGQQEKDELELGLSAETIVRFSPDGKSLWTAGIEDRVIEWDVERGRLRRRLDIEAVGATELVASPDGRLLALVGPGSVIQLIDVKTGRSSFEATGHVLPIQVASFTPDSKTILTGGGRRMCWWNAQDGRSLGWVETANGVVRALRILADGRRVAVYCDPLGVSVWDLATKRQLQEFCYASGALAFSPDGDSVSAANITSRGLDIVRHVGVPGNAEYLHLNGDFEALIWGDFTADGKSFVGWDSSHCWIHIYDAASGKERRRFSVRANGDSRMDDHKESCDAVLTPDSLGVFVGGCERLLALYDLLSGDKVWTSHKLPREVDRLTVSADGKSLAWTIPENPTVYVTEAVTGNLRRTIETAGRPVTALALSPDNHLLVTCDGDATALVWRLAPLDEGDKGRDLKTCWVDLASEDAGIAYKSMWKLAGRPKETLAFLPSKIAGIGGVDRASIEKLVEDLRGDSFAKRQSATQELELCAGLARPFLLRALQEKPTLEMKARLEKIVEKAGYPWRGISRDRLRGLRAVEVLETIGSQESRLALERLSREASDVGLAGEALNAVARLRDRLGN